MRTARLEIRLTAEERDLIARAAKFEGCTLSSYVRRFAVAEARKLAQWVELNPETPHYAGFRFRVASDFGLPGDEPDGVRWHQCAWSQCPNVVNEEGCVCPLHGVKP